MLLLPIFCFLLPLLAQATIVILQKRLMDMSDVLWPKVKILLLNLSKRKFTLVIVWVCCVAAKLLWYHEKCWKFILFVPYFSFLLLLWVCLFAVFILESNGFFIVPVVELGRVLIWIPDHLGLVSPICEPVFHMFPLGLLWPKFFWIMNIAVCCFL